MIWWCNWQYIWVQSNLNGCCLFHDTGWEKLFWSIDFCNYWIGNLDYPIKWKSSRQGFQLLKVFKVFNACTYGILVEDSILNRHINYCQTVEPEERLCILKKNGPQIIYYKLAINLPLYRNLNNQIRVTFVLSYTVSYIK